MRPTVEGWNVNGMISRKYEELRYLNEYTFGAIGVTSKGVVVYANDAMGRMVGAETKRLLGLHVEAFVPHKLESLHRRHVAGWFERPHVLFLSGKRRELPLVDSDGVEQKVGVMIVPYTLEGGDQEVIAVAQIFGRNTVNSVFSEARRAKITAYTMAIVLGALQALQFFGVL